MSKWISDSKVAEILSEVQLNPEIGSDDATFIESVIQRAARFLLSQIHIERYPENSQGYSLSGAGASTNISGLSTDTLLLSIDDDSYNEIQLTLASCTSGAATAAEIQTQIRDVGVTSYKFATCTFDSLTGKYQITSPTFGEASVVSVSYQAEYEHVCQALKLGPEFGGIEYAGGSHSPEFDAMVIHIVQHWYNKVGVEGMRSFSIPGSGSYTDSDIDPSVMAFIADHRRLV